MYFFSFCQARAIAEPFAYEEYRKEKIRKKIEEARATRIRLKVNPHSFSKSILVVGYYCIHSQRRFCGCSVVTVYVCVW